MIKARCITLPHLPPPSPLPARFSTSVHTPPILLQGLPSGTVGKNPPANAGDMGSVPGLGGFHMPRPHVLSQGSPIFHSSLKAELGIALESLQGKIDLI